MPDRKSGDLERIDSMNSQDSASKEIRKLSKNKRKTLLFLQHCAIAAAAVIALYIMFGSAVSVTGVDGGTVRYYMTSGMESDRSKQKSFEDSDLFRSLFMDESSDAMRLGTIRMQMETNGALDSSKKIDVAAFNRRNETIPDSYITADYHLGDLLKWNKYGFVYEDHTLTKQEQDAFLADKTRYRETDKKSDESLNYYDMNMYDSTYDISVEKKDDTFADNSSYDGTYAYDYGNEYAEDETPQKDDETSDDVFSILNCRYKTVDGDNVEDIVSNWDEYDNLCNEIETAAHNLSINYSDYSKYMSYYGKSNMKYFIRNDSSSTKHNFTNVSLNDTEEKSVTQTFKKFGKYLYYSPSDLIFDTNMDISEDDFRDILLSRYSGAYSENVKVWLAVDTSYPVQDSFSQAHEEYRDYIPYYWQLITMMFLFLLAASVILIILTVYEGRDGLLYRSDRLPAEINIVLIASLFVLMIFLFGEFIPSNSGEMYHLWMKIMFGAMAFIYDILFMFFYLSLIRRAKNGTFWHSTFLYHLSVWMSRGMWVIYDNGGLIGRTWFPFIFLIAVNAFGFVSGSPIPMMVVIVLDIAAGVFVYRQAKERRQILKCIDRIEDGDFSYKITTDKMHGDNLVMANAVNSIGNSIKKAVDTSTKDERLKADLITNVSHDIKTPLTSIISYVDLIKREDIDNDRLRGYVKVLDEKSQRLKQLTEDLVEASKISSGNIVLNIAKINMSELVQQTIGEFSDKFDASGLTVIVENSADNPYIAADSRRIWRVVENLFNNVCKYAMTGTRVYISIENIVSASGAAQLKTEVKNVSASELNCNPDELTERFIRGDSSRTTEGSGLGLSIAKSLTQMQKGTFKIVLDGDLFKAVLIFNSYIEDDHTEEKDQKT